MGLKSKENGNKGEAIVLAFFKSKGYWAHLTGRNSSGGQPVDIIALRGWSANVLCDAKYVSSHKNLRFYLEEDIQADQLTSLKYARDFSKVQNLGFAIVFEGFEDKPRFLTLKVYEALVGAGEKGVYMHELPTMEEMEAKVWSRRR